MSRRRTIVRLSAVLAVVALAKGCGDGESPSAPPTPEPARPTTVTVSPSTDELTALGQAIQLTAEVRDQNARVMAGATVTWTSSAISVATVDASGLVTAAGNGEATVTASAGEASGSAVVTVTQSVASVVVSPSTDELTALGETVQLTAEAFDGNGDAVAGTEFSWESSDVAVATVDAGGLVTGVAAGMATITASAGEASGSAVVTVTQSVASVVVSPSTDELTALGETVQLTAEAFDGNGDAVAGTEFSWESSDVAVATVDAGGLVTGVAAGMATITVSAGEASGSAVVTVTQSVASVVVSPSTDELTALGETVQLTAEAFDGNGHAVTGAEFSWESSDVAVATVDAGGLVTGVGKGTATITAITVEDPAFIGWLGSGSGNAAITVKISQTDSRYPIHVYFVGDVPEDLRIGAEAAAEDWGRILAPTPAAPFVFNEDWIEYRFDGTWSEISFKAGDTLEPGLHLYVTTTSDRYAAGQAWETHARQFGTSDVPMEPIGLVAFNAEYFASQREVYEDWDDIPGFFERLHRTTMHEVAHVLGVGMGDRWWEWLRVPDSNDPWNVYFTHPDAIAVFDRMGGTDFPTTTPKIPVSIDRAHWDLCTGAYDLMTELGSVLNVLTELTIASLAYGYVYDPAMVPNPDQKLNPVVWNAGSERGIGTGGICKDGQYDPNFGLSAGRAPNLWELGSFEGDVIGGPEW